MSDSRETSNGNFVYPLNEGVMTVFKRKDGYWGGVHDGNFLKGKFEAPEEAQERMERLVFDNEEQLAKTIQSGWKVAKSGGYYREYQAGVISIKQARNGNWYIATSSDGVVKDQWLESAHEAMNKADQIFNL
jgi:hypothetical protein